MIFLVFNRFRFRWRLFKKKILKINRMNKIKSKLILKKKYFWFKMKMEMKMRIHFMKNLFECK
jgi:hypothetical protein